MSQDTIFVILVFIVIAVLFLFREKEMAATPIPVEETKPDAVGSTGVMGTTMTYYNSNQPFNRQLV